MFRNLLVNQPFDLLALGAMMRSMLIGDAKSNPLTFSNLTIVGMLCNFQGSLRKGLWAAFHLVPAHTSES